MLIEPRAVYTTGQLARAFGVTITTVNKWIDSGKLQAFRLPRGGHRRVLYRDLQSFLIACRRDIDEAKKRQEWQGKGTMTPEEIKRRARALRMERVEREELVG
jgi:excisionase family DNA binding protein